MSNVNESIEVKTFSHLCDGLPINCDEVDEEEVESMTIVKVSKIHLFNYDFEANNFFYVFQFNCIFRARTLLCFFFDKQRTLLFKSEIAITVWGNLK